MDSDAGTSAIFGRKFFNYEQSVEFSHDNSTTSLDGFTVPISAALSSLSDLIWDISAAQSHDLSDMYLDLLLSITSESIDLEGIASDENQLEAEILYNAANLLSIDVEMEVA